MWNASFVSKKTSIKLARPNKGIGRIGHRNPNHFLGAVSTNQSYTRSFYIDVFSRDGQDGFDISRRCGLLLHGDEGRSLRKRAILILSCHSILRYGIRTSCCSTRKIPTNWTTWNLHGRRDSCWVFCQRLRTRWMTNQLSPMMILGDLMCRKAFWTL